VLQISMETALARGQSPPENRDATRPAFSHYLALGLEFIIGASLIKTVLSPDLQQVGIVGGLVLIRALVGHYPRWEKPRTAQVATATSGDHATTPAQSALSAESSVVAARLSAPNVGATNGTDDACVATASVAT